MHRIVALMIVLTLGVACARAADAQKVVVLASGFGRVDNVLKAGQQPVEKHRDYLVVDISNHDLSLANFARAWAVDRLALDVIARNIENAGVQSTVSGQPYRRQIVVVDERGEPKTGPDSSDLRYVYDPTNPSSLKEGKWKGYIPMPNVNINVERADWMATTHELRLLAEILKRIEPSIVLDMPDSSPPLGSSPPMGPPITPQGRLPRPQPMPFTLPPPKRH